MPSFLGEGIKSLGLCWGFCEGTRICGLVNKKTGGGLGEVHKDRGFEEQHRARGLGEEQTELCFGEDE